MQGPRLSSPNAFWIYFFGPDERERRAEPPRWLTVTLIALILVAAATLRISRLAELPAGFFCDEAGLGYSAYSILHTGRDETGTRWPLFVWSFNVSYKNPVFIYSAILPIAVLGLTEFAVRLTAALYGVATVAALFFLGRALMGTWVGLLAALFLAVCPWHLHFSRIGFELITFPFFFVLAATNLVQYLRGRRRLALAMACGGICLYTYAIAKVFVPVFLLGFALLAARPLRERRRESLAAAGVLFLVLAPAVAFDLTHHERTTRYFGRNTILAAATSPAEGWHRFATNYTAFFSPDFLFRTGETLTPRHAVPHHGELLPLFAPLFLIGLATLVCREDRAMRLPLWWLAAYPLAPALMMEIPSASRGIIGAPAFCLVSAIGAGIGLRLLARISARPALAIGLPAGAAAAGMGLLVAQAHQYWTLYVDAYPRYSAVSYTGFQFGHRQVVDYFRTHRDEYDTMVIHNHLNNQPQIFLLFYEAFFPARFQAEGLAGLLAATKMRAGDPDELDLYRDRRRLLFALTDDELSLLADADIRATVTAPDGSAAFRLVAARALKDFVPAWWVSAPFAAATDPPLPDFDPTATGPDGPLAAGWQRLVSRRAAVDFDRTVPHAAEPACVWAVNVLDSDAEQLVTVHTGFHAAGAVWINREPVPLEAQPGDALADTARGMARLRAGRNRVTLRSCSGPRDWRFYFRLADRADGRLGGVSWGN